MVRHVAPAEIIGAAKAAPASPVSTPMYSGIYIYCAKSTTCISVNDEDIFRSSIGCEIMLMIKARIRLIFSRYNIVKVRMKFNFL